MNLLFSRFSKTCGLAGTPINCKAGQLINCKAGQLCTPSKLSKAFNPNVTTTYLSGSNSQ